MGTIIQFPKDKSTQPIQVHEHGPSCTCEACVLHNNVMADIKEQRAAFTRTDVERSFDRLRSMEDPRTNSETVRAYERSLIKGLENWATNPQQSMFSSITDQLIKDGIVRT